MAYCRWSTDDFQCDLYVYEHVHGGWAIHVASHRIIPQEPFPPALTIEDPGFVDRWEKVRKILDEGEHVKIGLPFDGKSFYPQEKGETVEILKMLREAGYRFPERVIADIEEEDC